ncbi:MAG: GHKL domain-containing protein, partial [Clostridiaceae bacterium]|nr:GHKL domain-containing protein [Clostridiaceae bacterium]
MDTFIMILINYVLVAMINALITSILTQAVYNRKYKLKDNVLYIVSFTIVFGTIVNFSDFVLYDYSKDIAMVVKTIATFLSGVIHLKVFYKISYIKSIVALGMYYIILGIGNGIVFAVSSLGGYGYIFLKSSVLMQLYAYLIIDSVNILIVLLIKYLRLIFTLPHDIRFKTHWTNLSYIVFTFIIISLANIFFMDFSRFFSSINFIINVLLIIVFLIFSIINTNTFFKLESKSHELEYQVFYNRSLEVLMNDLRRIRHNHSNMLAVLGGYIKIKKWDELERYFSEVCSDLSAISSLSNLTSLNIKSAGILGLIMSKLEYAKEKGVTLKIVNTDEVSEVNMKISELCEVLGILLDNAIEAAGDSDNKLVELVVCNEDNIVTFCVENTISREISVHKIFDEGYSTKG